MRLFAALVPPAPILDEIEALLRDADGLDGLRRTRRDQWHVTLAFYGDMDEATCERLLPRLERATLRRLPLTLAFAGAGAFPRPTGAHTLWLGVRGDRDALDLAASTAEAAGQRASRVGGRRAESARPGARGRRGHRPHLTVARAGHAMDMTAQVMALEDFAGAGWTADRLHLIRSYLGPRPRYETIRTFPG
jgi:2'-5' RNA ligase